jgi:hypothetical protein
MFALFSRQSGENNMNGMDEQQQAINARMARPEPLVSDDEVRAAKGVLDRMPALAGREQPVPDTLIRFMLEEAAMVRVGMIKLAPLSNGERA